MRAELASDFAFSPLSDGLRQRRKYNLLVPAAPPLLQSQIRQYQVMVGDNYVCALKVVACAEERALFEKERRLLLQPRWSVVPLSMPHQAAAH